jgi:acetyl esterase/lipase
VICQQTIPISSHRILLPARPARGSRSVLRCAPVSLTAIVLMAAPLGGCSLTALVNALTPTSGYSTYSDLDYGGGARQRLDVYVPEELQERAPVVVFFYGGRWQRGDKERYRFVGQALASRGLVTVIADYRQYPEVKFPGFVEDGARALAWTRSNISRYGGDPRAMFVMGHSAGAHIAAMLVFDERYLHAVGGSGEWLRGMIGLAGPYDFLPLTDDVLKDLFGPPDRYTESQPIAFVDGTEPPLLLLHGLKDETVLVRNTRNLAQRVLEQGGRADTILYPQLDHIKIIGALAAPVRGIAPVLDDTVSFIRATIEAPDRCEAPSRVAKFSAVLRAGNLPGTATSN